MGVDVATQALPIGDAVGRVTHHSGFSVPTFGDVPEKSASPSAPGIDSMAAPTQTSGILVLSITMPTTDTDGDVLAESEITRIRMHHNTSAGVDVNDSYVDFPPGETLQWGPGDVVAHYVAIRVKDSHDNWSVLSNELSGTANAGTEPEYAGLWAHRMGNDAVWTEDSPAPGSIAWSGVVLYWKDQRYEITDGNTDKIYVWWDYNVSTTEFQTSDTVPTLTFEDVLIATNDSGTLYLQMYSPMILADFLRAGVIQSTNWAATTGSMIDLDGGRIVLGGSNEGGFVAEPTGAVSMGSDFTWDTVEAILRGTLKTTDSGIRIAMYGANAGVGLLHHLYAYDATGKRIVMDYAEIRIYESDTTTTLSVFPSTPGTVAFIGNDEVIVNNTLIVGRDTDPATADILHVTGAGLFTSTVVVGDHAEDDTPSVVNVIFYNGTTIPLPAANTTPRGTFAVQVPA